MSRRYYCDYCDKSFVDEIESRRKHLSKVHHLKLKKLHYDSYRDLRTILQEEAAKGPCRRYQANGYCQFETNCLYTHYTQQQLYDIKQHVEYEDRAKLQQVLQKPEIPTIEAWIEKYGQEKSLDKTDEDDMVTPFWAYPEHLESRTDLPLSLQKIQPEHIKSSTFAEWGP